MNKYGVFALIIVAFIPANGCSRRMVYDSIRQNRMLECQKMQGAERENCLRQTDLEYDEYQRQREKQQTAK